MTPFLTCLHYLLINELLEPNDFTSLLVKMHWQGFEFVGFFSYVEGVWYSSSGHIRDAVNGSSLILVFGGMISHLA